MGQRVFNKLVRVYSDKQTCLLFVQKQPYISHHYMSAEPVQGHVIIDTFWVMTLVDLRFFLASQCMLTVIIVQLQRVQVKGHIVYNTAATDIISSLCCYGGIHYCISF
jgi:hypothetical protein